MLFEIMKYIDIYLMCKEFHCLPYNGGYFEQANKMMEIFKLIYLNLQEKEKQELEKVRLKNIKWQQKK